MNTNRYLTTMAGNFTQLVLGTYRVQIDANKFVIEQMERTSAVIAAKDNPDLKAMISIDEVPRGMNRHDVWRDTVSRDTTGILHKMLDIATSTIASMALIHSNLNVNGRPGFDLFITNSELGLSAYRIAFWLDENDAIDVFASFPSESGFQSEIMDLANTLHVSES